MTAQATWQEFEAWAEAVARSMGFTFRAPAADMKGYAINGWLVSGGVEIALDYAAHKGRVELRPVWPTGTYGVTRSNELPGAITVGYGRYANLVALDIAKRLVRPMRLALADVNERLAAQAGREAAQAAAFARVMAAGSIDGGNVLSAITHRTAEAGFYGLTDGYGSVTIGHDGSTGSIELRGLDVEVIVEIVERLVALETDARADAKLAARDAQEIALDA